MRSKARNVIRPIGGGISEIQLKESVALVNDHDVPNIEFIKWYGIRVGNTYYARGRITSTSATTSLHRVIMCFPLLHVDHINGDGLDNRRENLRLATHQQNLFNCRKKSGTTSKFFGVRLSPWGKWEVRARVGGAMVQVGTFASEEDAAKAYDRCILAARGQFAKTNFPMETYQS
jgi:hypothetical protein